MEVLRCYPPPCLALPTSLSPLCPRQVDHDLEMFRNDAYVLHHKMQQSTASQPNREENLSLILRLVTGTPAVLHRPRPSPGWGKGPPCSHVRAWLTPCCAAPLPRCRVIDLADECLENSVDDFKLTITDVVDSLEVMLFPGCVLAACPHELKACR